MSNDRRNDGAAGTDPRSEPTPKSSGSLNSSRPRRPRGTGVTPGRSIRVPTDVWDKAKARCNGEDHVNVSHLCTELLRAYGARTIDMSAGLTASASGQADGSAPLTGRSEAPVDPDALRIIIDSYRALADRLEALLDDPAAATASPPELGPRPSPRGAVFDPETSVPPVAPMPTGGTREQADWCGLIFFGMLRAINVVRVAARRQANVRRSHAPLATRMRVPTPGGPGRGKTARTVAGSPRMTTHRPRAGEVA